MDYQIISIESRKGGVGKTTAALNLSRLLLDKEYTVLLIDLDITGTNIIDTLDSSYWINNSNPIYYNGKPANLLEIYQNSFMCGKELPRWKIIDNENNEGFSIDNKKINIIGSQIYKEKNKNSKNIIDNYNKLICKPSILFDELHTFWFVEFLQNICKGFTDIINKEKKEKIAIILDNSPGYIGINPSIQEWLTDLGPIRGKFLTVSSLDKQDLISCGNTIDELHSIFINKFNAAVKYFNSKRNNKEEIKLDKGEEKFFLRLLSNNKSEDINYYNFGVAKTDNNRYIINPSKYQAIIINKVPEELKFPIFQFNFHKVWEKREMPEIIEKIIINNDIKNHFIYYDDLINFQFDASLISKEKHSRSYIQQNSLKKYFNKIISNKIKKDNLKKYEPDHIKGIQHYQFILKNIKVFQETLDELLEKLRISNFQNITRLIDKEWHPITPFERLRQYFIEIMDRSDFPIMDFDDNYQENDNLYQNNYLNELLYSIEQRYRNEEIITHTFNDIESSYSNKAVIYIILAPFSNFSPKLIEELSEIFVLVLKIQNERFEKQNINKLEQFDFKGFLISEKLTVNEIRKFDEMHFFSRLHLNREIRTNFIVDFYNSFCNAQARVLDLEKDFDFLINVIKKVTLDNNINEEEIVFPNIRDILNKVIIDKTISHSIANVSLQKGFEKAYCMQEFQDKLNEIINIWEIQ